MIKAEQKPLEDLVTHKDKPLTSSRYLVAHFGNGDEDD